MKINIQKAIVKNHFVSKDQISDKDEGWIYDKVFESNFIMVSVSIWIVKYLMFGAITC